MSTEVREMFKVISPVERNGKTYWQRLGSGFRNRDRSINMYLDSFPTNGKLQLREMTEEDFAPREGRRPHGVIPVAAEASDDQLPF